MSRARLQVLLAAVLWSTNGLFVKSPPLAALGAETWGGIQIACLRALFAARGLRYSGNWRRPADASVPGRLRGTGADRGMTP